MRFRPSYYSQVQLTSYAPNGGYPGFYGGEEDEIQFQSSVGEMKQEEAEEPGALAKFGGWLWRTFGGKVEEKAKEVAGDAVTKLTSGGTSGGGTVTQPSTSTIKIPSNLTAAERALIDACKSKNVFQRPACLAAAVRKIEADRAAAKKAGASSTLWWILGGTVVVGGVVAAVALSKKGKRS